MENFKYRVIYEYEFHRGTNTAEKAHRIKDVYGAARYCKRKHATFLVLTFSSGNFDIQNKPHGKLKTQVNNEELKVNVEADPS